MKDAPDAVGAALGFPVAAVKDENALVGALVGGAAAEGTEVPKLKAPPAGGVAVDDEVALPNWNGLLI